jgi:hypothetical protein
MVQSRGDPSEFLTRAPTRSCLLFLVLFAVWFVEESQQLEGERQEKRDIQRENCHPQSASKGRGGRISSFMHLLAAAASSFVFFCILS